MNAVYISIGIILVLVGLCIAFRKQIVNRLYRLKMKVQLMTLRTAIHDADGDKEKTGRKNMVIYNSTQGKFEPIQKKKLKLVAAAGKNKSNKSLTAGRKKRKVPARKRLIDIDRVRNIEEKSLYKTS